MQLQETGEDRARLYIPAELRDDLNLTEFEEVSIHLDCENGHPVAFITTVSENDDHDGVIRSLTVGSNRQVQLDFPRQIAVAASLLDTELTLERRNDQLVLSPDE
ncbi:MAG: hypothetical protein SVU32_00980 [Candidatus Nanohaloarchaea archaeon]|nr:hypothetical protein [Candidatus Nanohaloarchaea archaeon]